MDSDMRLKESKYIIFGIVIVFCIYFSLGLFFSSSSTIHLVHEDYSQQYIDYLIKINNEIVFQDSVNLEILGYQNKEVDLRIGINKIEVYAYNNEVYKRKYILNILSDHILVYNLPECDNEKRCVHIRNTIRPFALE